MRHKASKRQRKHKDSQSLKRKQTGQQATALDLLDEQLTIAAQEQGVDDANALILPSGKANTAVAAQDEGPVLSKAEQRKLRQVEQKKARRVELVQAFENIAQHKLDDQQLSLLVPMHQRGARETKKQRLKRLLRLQRAGVQLPEALSADSGRKRSKRPAELLRERKRARQDGSGSDSDGAGSSSSSGSGSDASDADMNEEEQAAAPVSAHQAAAAAAPSKQPTKTAAAPAAADLGATAEDAEKQQQEQLQLAREEARRVKQQLGIADMEVDEEDVALQQQLAAEASAGAGLGPTRVVQVVRAPDIEEGRRQLPIVAMEQEIMEAINLNDVVVLCGETGCGKTTQVPQFLLEAGYGCKDFPEKAGAIGVTQPRRVAAISTAARVAAELGSSVGDLVGYQVRYDKRVGGSSAVRFMTDGILLRQLQSDFLLRSYSVLLIDEAHERSLNTDLLLGLLSRVVPLRRKLHQQWVAAGSVGEGSYPLKVIIMSATLRTSDFTENKTLFPSPPPVVSVPARQFPVTIHFSKRTELHDYLGAAVRKVCRIHRELPPGGILLFLTGQREVEVAVRRIRATFEPKHRRAGTSSRGQGSSKQPGANSAFKGLDRGGSKGAEVEDEDVATGADATEAAGGEAALTAEALAAGEEQGWGDEIDDFDQMEADEDEEEVQVLGGDAFTPEEIAAAEAAFEARYGLKLGSFGSKGPEPATTGLPSSEAAAGTASAAAAGQGASTPAEPSAAAGAAGEQQRAAPVHVLPLYALLPQAAQQAVFKAPPPGHRLIVVATNVAETSLTIPGVRYVVDAGRSKQKLLEAEGGGLERFVVDWVSKAAAEQRAGRAGRTGPGHTYRLYSSALYQEAFTQHTAPEIQNTRLEGVMLVLKAMGVDKVMNFPFPSPPSLEALKAAAACLLALGAVSPPAAAGPSLWVNSGQHNGQSSGMTLQAVAAAVAGPLTKLGQAMAVFPISPRHCRMLLEVAGIGSDSNSNSSSPPTSSSSSSSRAALEALPYAVALAAALTTESPFVHTDNLAADSSSQPQPGGEAADAMAAAADAADLEARRRKQQAASAAHAKFRGDGDGDALAVLRVLCAYEAAGQQQQSAFCAQNHLHARQLREMSQLRRQLARMLRQQLAQAVAADPSLQPLVGALQQQPQLLGGAGPLPPPTRAVCDVLRRALAVGWCDQVARRVRSAEYVAKLQEQGRKRHAMRYQPAVLQEEVYLHPRSTLAATAPEYVVYSTLLATDKRRYLVGVTPLEPHWLASSGTPLCSVSAPLVDPPPFYSPERDAVLAWHDASYGPHTWALPRLAAPAAEPLQRAAAFAGALLGGRVLPPLGQLQQVLVAPAGSAGRAELAGLPRVGELLAALQQRQVFSRAALAAAWQLDPSYLRPQVTAWVHKQHRREVDRVWPQLLAAAAAGGDGGVERQHTKKKKKQRQGSKL